MQSGRIKLLSVEAMTTGTLVTEDWRQENETVGYVKSHLSQLPPLGYYPRLCRQLGLFYFDRQQPREEMARRSFGRRAIG
jgi:hypothetical protein